MGPTLLILAAGRGSRFGGPKQLAPVGPNGEPLLAYTIHDALRGGFERIVLLCPPDRADELEEVSRAWAAPEVDIDTVEQAVPPDRMKPWGTGHAVLEARQRLGERAFGVANGDDFYGRDALVVLGEALRDRERSAQILVTYALGRTLAHTQHVSRGFCRIQDGRLEAIEEIQDVHFADGETGTPARGRRLDGEPVEAGGDQPVSMNLWGFVPPFLELLDERWATFLSSRPSPGDEFLLPHAVGELIEAGRIRVAAVPTVETPFGLTRPEDLETARAEIARRIASGVYPADLRSGST